MDLLCCHKRQPPTHLHAVHGGSATPHGRKRHSHYLPDSDERGRLLTKEKAAKLSDRLVTLRVCKAELPYNGHLIGSANLYVVVKWEGETSHCDWEIHVSPTLWLNAKAPEWNHCCPGQNEGSFHSGCSVTFEVWEDSYTFFSERESIGSATVPASSLLEGALHVGESAERDIALWKEDDEAGSMTVQVFLESEEVAETCRRLSLAHQHIHLSESSDHPLHELHESHAIDEEQREQHQRPIRRSVLKVESPRSHSDSRGRARRRASSSSSTSSCGSEPAEEEEDSPVNKVEDAMMRRFAKVPAEDSSFSLEQALQHSSPRGSPRASPRASPRVSPPREASAPSVVPVQGKVVGRAAHGEPTPSPRHNHQAERVPNTLQVKANPELKALKILESVKGHVVKGVKMPGLSPRGLVSPRCAEAPQEAVRVGEHTPRGDGMATLQLLVKRLRVTAKKYPRHGGPFQKAKERFFAITRERNSQGQGTEENVAEELKLAWFENEAAWNKRAKPQGDMKLQDILGTAVAQQSAGFMVTISFREEDSDKGELRVIFGSALAAEEWSRNLDELREVICRH